MSSNYHFHKLNVASAEFQSSPATPITNTIQCEITAYFLTWTVLDLTYSSLSLKFES